VNEVAGDGVFLRKLVDKDVEIVALKKQLTSLMTQTRPSRSAMTEIAEITSLLLYARQKKDASEAKLMREN